MCAQNYDPGYLSYFECFNRQHFFESHEVLEALWLPQRQGPNGLFYKGLIQLAGAFVHLQKNRLGPAAALFALAQSNLQKYPATHEGLAVDGVLGMIEDWLQKSRSAGTVTNPYTPAEAPRLCLQTSGSRD
jgi:predicted metal-dependent hydrolase